MRCLKRRKWAPASARWPAPIHCCVTHSLEYRLSLAAAIQHKTYESSKAFALLDVYPRRKGHCLFRQILLAMP